MIRLFTLTTSWNVNINIYSKGSMYILTIENIDVNYDIPWAYDTVDIPCMV